ncbi:P-loop containing nucleoside triphosphate hydrolases superfamily protein [Striga hermonthica]|uniref:P-loop containing nucleoside triphosphate hydrolases superfamily protein n=1 Tax=Striga hermonthica TaxID=68872 RepID=A0A9N7NQS3_STRHE|nr:P-loop containing nucleoside triphosphate hydrolases superfamily protein [Striga hermonthica]
MAEIIKMQFRDKLLEKIVAPEDLLNYSWKKFPYYINEHDKNVLIECVVGRLKRNKCSRLVSSTGRISLRSFPGDRVKYIGQSSYIKENNRTLCSGQRGIVRELNDDKVAVFFYISGLRTKEAEEKDAKIQVPFVQWLDAKDFEHDDDARIHNCHVGMEVLCEILESRQPIIVYFSDAFPFRWFPKTASSKIRKEFHRKLKDMLDQLWGRMVLICGQSSWEVGSQESANSVSFLRDPYNVVVFYFPCLKKLINEPEVTNYTQLEETKMIFPNVVPISVPTEDNILKTFCEQIHEDWKMLTSRNNLSEMRKVLKKYGLKCNGVDRVNTDGLNLNKQKAEKIIGWATNHYLFSCDLPSFNEVPQESVELAVMRLKELETKSKKEPSKTPKDLASDDYEMTFVPSVISAEEIGIKFDDVGALENVKKALNEIFILPLKRPELFSRGNLLRPCKGLLLFGPPGTGKTLMAKALATESGANFINITPSSLTSMWYGDEENLTRGLFSFARKLAPVIIFVDEVDALLGARGGNSEHEATRRLRNEFMACWDGLTSKDNERILVIGATNRPFDLDDAVIRRMPRRIYVDLPDVEVRLKILKVILAKEELENGFSYEQLAKATESYSGSDLKNLCVAAAYIPVQEFLEEESKASNPLHMVADSVSLLGLGIITKNLNLPVKVVFRGICWEVGSQ